MIVCMCVCMCMVCVTQNDVIKQQQTEREK